MNKNWLYRVLALALVAMLALPMFALAEEAGQAEAVIEEQDSALIGDASDASGIIMDTHPVDDGLYDDPADESLLPYVICDANSPSTQYRTCYLGEQADLADYFTDCLGYDDADLPETFPQKFQIYDKNFSKVSSFKSSKKAVATVNSEGVIFCGGVGKATITVKGKNSSGKPASCKVVVTVIDPFEAKKIIDAAAYTKLLGIKIAVASTGLSVLPGMFIPANQPNDDCATNMNWTALGYTGNVTTVDAFAAIETADDGDIVLPDNIFAFYPAIGNADDIDITALYNRGVTYSTSSSKVLPEVKAPLTDTYGFLAWKPGKAKVTMRVAGVAGKKSASVTIPVTVLSNEINFGAPSDRAKAIAAANDMLLYGIQSIKIKDADTVEVTLFFVNPTNVSISCLDNFAFEITGSGMNADGSLQTDPFVSYYTPELKKSIKAAGKKGPTVTTIKVTATGAQTGDVLQLFSNLNYQAEITNIYFDRMGAFADANGNVVQAAEFTGLKINNIWNLD